MADGLKRAKKRPWIGRLVAVSLLLVLSIIVVGCPKDTEARETVMIKGHSFDLELAITEPQRNQGLMGREAIDPNGGMLFVFPDAQRRSFWMKNCLVDIDLIYLDGRGRVAGTHRMKAEPPRTDNETEADYEARMTSYPSYFPAQFVIELQAGWLDRLDLRVEEKIELDLDRLKDLPR